MAVMEKKPWEVTSPKVDAAIRKIIEISHPKKLILFGSYVKNTANINSDVDFLIVTGDHIKNPRKESVRIRRALRGISMPMDILVVPESKWRQVKDAPWLIYREATDYGQVVYESKE